MSDRCTVYLLTHDMVTDRTWLERIGIWRKKIEPPEASKKKIRCTRGEAVDWEPFC